MRKNCLICKKEFESNYLTKKCCSKECKKEYKKEYRKTSSRKEYDKEYRQDHKEESHMYYENHKEEKREYDKKYGQTPKGKESHKKSSKKYQQTLKGKEIGSKIHKKYLQTPKGIIAMKNADKKCKSKRNRDLDFIPLNNWFEDSHAHHINKKYVIYIPKELHLKFYGHSVLKNRKMGDINMASFDYLINGKY